jgi:hypothetical protein
VHSEKRAPPGRVGVKGLRPRVFAVADLVDADLGPVRSRPNISESAALAVAWTGGDLRPSGQTAQVDGSGEGGRCSTDGAPK